MRQQRRGTTMKKKTKKLRSKTDVVNELIMHAKNLATGKAHTAFPVVKAAEELIEIEAAEAKLESEKEKIEADEF